MRTRVALLQFTACAMLAGCGGPAVVHVGRIGHVVSPASPAPALLSPPPKTARREVASATPRAEPARSTCLDRAAHDANAPLALVWRDDTWLSVFWAVDQASRWSDSGADTYPSFFAKDVATSSEERRADTEALAAYAKLRAKYSAETSWPEPDPAAPSDMLPPRANAADRFTEAFLCASTPRAAAAAIGMSEDEQRAVSFVFERFRPRLEASYTRAPFLPRAMQGLESLAERSKMSEFLGSMRRFYASDALPSPLYVDLIWAPPSMRHQATAVGAHMVIPIHEAVAHDEKGLAGWLGVVVHEFGHQFLAYVSDARRRELSDAIAGRGGILQRRHANAVDEAMQSAFGNLLFLRERLPEGLDERQIYSFEPELEYPDLIDSLARKTEPLVKDALAHGAVLDARFVDAVLALQASIAPPRLAHFSRAALVFVGGKNDRLAFDGLFWGRSRFAISDVEDFARTSSRATAIARWVLVTTPELEKDRDALTRTMPDAGRAARDLDQGWAGCVRASPRASGTWDVAVVAKNDDAMRRTLIAVQRGVAPRDAHPFCVR